MKYVVRKSEGQRKEVGDTVVTEYFGLEAPSLGLAAAEINEYYPAADKWALNRDVEEMYFVVSGKGNAEIEGVGSFAIGPTDALWIPKGKKYRVRGEHLHVVIPTGPAWTLEQHEWV